MLIDKDASLKDTDNEGNAPMHLAAKRGDMSIMCKLHTAGACPYQPGNYTIILTSLPQVYSNNNTLLFNVFLFYFIYILNYSDVKVNTVTICYIALQVRAALNW